MSSTGYIRDFNPILKSDVDDILNELVLFLLVLKKNNARGGTINNSHKNSGL
jgi:hypothetical protein|tara:strand:- start:423 stop:578 length:156 start_codon:yes stop_codon:yes gene_type:complete